MCDRAEFSGNFFAQNQENEQKKKKKKRTKTGFFELIEKFGPFYWICCVMKIYIICSNPAQIPYLENFYIWDMGQNNFTQLDSRIFQSTTSPEQIN